MCSIKWAFSALIMLEDIITMDSSFLTKENAI